MALSSSKIQPSVINQIKLSLIRPDLISIYKSEHKIEKYLSNLNFNNL